MSQGSTDYRALPVSERIELVEDIWDSIAEDTAASALPLSDEQRAELHRRLAEHRADPASGIPWAEVRAALFKGQV